MTDEPTSDLESARSKVRRRVTYGAGIVSALATGYGLYLQEPTIYMPGLIMALSILSFWFAQRNPKS